MLLPNSFGKYRFRDIPVDALALVANTLAYGFDKYGKKNTWQEQDAEEQLEHALQHLFLELKGDRSENHSAHAICRLLFYLGLKPGEFELEVYNERTNVR